MAQDMMPLLLVGGLAIGGFLLVQSGMLSSLFPAPAAAAPVAPVSGSVNTTTSTTATPCMGTSLLNGQPCTCPGTAATLPTTATAMGYAYPAIIPNSARLPPPIKKSNRGRDGRLIGVVPSIGLGTSLGLGATPSQFCDCSACGGSTAATGLPTSTSSPYPSTLGSSASDLNNFVGGSIAQEGYGFNRSGF
jgi:hypothetical protein